MFGESETVPATWRRCPALDHDHEDGKGVLFWLAEPALVQALEAQTPLAAALRSDGLLEELDRRWCAAGPLIVDADGLPYERLAASDFLNWPEDASDLTWPNVPSRDADNGLLERVESLRRITALQAIFATWNFLADVERQPSQLLGEVDHPHTD